MEFYWIIFDFIGVFFVFMSKKEEKKKGESNNTLEKATKNEEKNTKSEQTVKKLEDSYNVQDFQQGYELLLQSLKENSMNIRLLIQKMRYEFQLKKIEECMISCNLLLFLQPHNLEAHQMKLNILKSQKKFNYLSDCLVSAMTLFPDISFT